MGRGTCRTASDAQIVRSRHVNQNVRIRRANKAGNACQNTVIDTCSKASEFFKFDPETYLKAPVYGRDDPAYKFCE